MFNYSFMSKYATNKYEEVEEFLKSTTKPILYTHGLGYRHPTIYKQPIDLERALKITGNRGEIFDLEEYEDYVHLNTFSENDLW